MSHLGADPAIPPHAFVIEKAILHSSHAPREGVGAKTRAPGGGSGAPQILLDMSDPYPSREK